MRFLMTALLFGALTTMAAAKEHQCALSFEVKNIDGKTVDLHDYKGKVVLIVNVASQCGLTPQYAGLQELYSKYKGDGLVVLGFPCNQFGAQEPGTETEIKQFCTSEFSVSFPMFAKVEVNGEDAAPLFKHLTGQEAGPEGKGRVGWNFAKFLVDREGNLTGRFKPNTEPSDAKLVKAIETELKKKKK